MASNDQLVQFPRGQVSFGSGPLQNCTDFSSTTTNGGKLVSTLRRNPGGFVLGKKAVSFDMNLQVDEDGDERDWEDLVDKGTPQTIRLKIPGGATRSLRCIIIEVGTKFTIEDGVARPIKGVGMWIKKK
jgi:hypothetical protein